MTRRGRRLSPKGLGISLAVSGCLLAGASGIAAFRAAPGELPGIIPPSSPIADGLPRPVAPREGAGEIAALLEASRTLRGGDSVAAVVAPPPPPPPPPSGGPLDGAWEYVAMMKNEENGWAVLQRAPRPGAELLARGLPAKPAAVKRPAGSRRTSEGAARDQVVLRVGEEWSPGDGQGRIRVLEITMDSLLYALYDGPDRGNDRYTLRRNDAGKDGLRQHFVGAAGGPPETGRPKEFLR